jgi:hypothetical protein
VVVDAGVQDVAGPLGSALDHLDDVVSESFIFFITLQLFWLLPNVQLLELVKALINFLWEDNFVS